MKQISSWCVAASSRCLLALGLLVLATPACDQAEPIVVQDDSGLHEQLEASLTKGSGGNNGDSDYCDDPANLCTTGEGDCDDNAQCATGLLCGVDNGPKYGMPSGWDVCWPDLCENGLLDGDEVQVDCGGGCGTCSCTGTNGDTNFCSPTCRCGSGQGDCDHDTHCATGLVCGTDNGDRFGMPSYSWDVCWPAHCENGTQDGNETSPDCGGSCGPCTCGGTNGTEDYCTPTCPCASGEGDCDNNGQCTSGNVCGTDNGARFGFSKTTDVCWSSTCASKVPGAADYCSAACPCTTGQGDCDTATECAPGLTCGTDNGALWGFPATLDMCWPPACGTRVLNATDYCRKDCPCLQGQGDCDSNLECGPGLVCGTDNGPRFGQPAIWDMCWSSVCPTLTPGAADYCRPECPCLTGEGDCDANNHCAPGLVCGTDNGARYGFAASWDMCWPSHCQNGAQDGDETSVDCGGSCGGPCP